MNQMVPIAERIGAAVGGMIALAAVLDTCGKVIAIDPLSLDQAGLDETRVVGQHFADTFWWSYSTAAGDAMRHDIARARAGLIVRRETVIRSLGAARLPIMLQVSPNLSPGGAVDEIVVVAMGLERDGSDIALMRGEIARLTTMNRELVHRIKNMFGAVMATLSISYRQTDSREAMREMACSRIAALSRAHLLSVDAGDRLPAAPVALENLVRATVGPHLPDDLALWLDGPPVTIRVAAITPLTLVLHELATNATKYGALSHADGTLRVEWTGPQEAEAWKPTDRASCWMTWTEEFDNSVRDAVALPGFGSALVERCVEQLQGSVEIVSSASGYRVVLRFDA